MIQIESCDILLVTDESVNARKCVDRIVTATKTLKQKLDFLQSGLESQQVAPFIMCERAFFVVNGESSPLESTVIPWIHMLPMIQSNYDKCFILCIGEADSAKFEQYEAMGIYPENVVYVKYMDMLDTWWPKALRFLYNVNQRGNNENGSDFYLWPVQTSDNEVKTMATSIESLLTNAGLLKGSTPEESKCVVAIFNSPLGDDDREMANKFHQVADIGGKYVHVITTDKDTARGESFGTHCAIYDKTEMMECLLWIMSDLRYVGQRRPKNKKPKSCGDVCNPVL